MRIVLLVLLFGIFPLMAQERGDVDYVFTSLEEAEQYPDYVYHLSLSKQKLEAFPDHLDRFPHLKTLDLSKNRISLLPASIGKLVGLEELNLEKNKIYSLPPQLKELSNLKVLLLARNDVESVPKEIGALEQLEKLDFWSNNIKTIDPNIQQLEYLKVLDLRGMIFSDELKKQLVLWLPETTILFSGGCDCGF